MSRIDEAMRRASHAPYTGRGPTRGADGSGSLRLAEDFTLNEYPLEARAGARVEKTLASEPRVPAEPRILTTPNQSQKRRARMPLDQESNAKLVVGAARNMVSAEQYRRLAAALHDVQVDKGLKTVMVTSAIPREGKTLTVVNLALTLSESYGRRVLLVDADLRRPSVHEVLRVPNDRGLSEVLVSNRQELPLVEAAERLWVLPSGRTEGSPLAVLSSDRMRTFLEDVTGRFDWVLLDTPPVGLLPDAQVLGRLVHAAVFVIRAGHTPFAVVEKAIADLGRECIIGTVLNDVDPVSLPTTAYYGHYYASHT
jgi:capsular exopolysaccharide synthesis family protein